MADDRQTTRFRCWLWLIRFAGLIVPRRLRADWRQEWEAELRYALWLQPQRWEDEMFQDLRFGVRMLLMNKSFTLISILLLALGIGANTAIFSVVDTILLKMLPVKDPERLVLLSRSSGVTRTDSFTYNMYEQFRDHDQTLSGVLSYYPLRLTVSVDGQPEPAINGQLVTGNYYC